MTASPFRILSVNAPRSRQAVAPATAAETLPGGVNAYLEKLMKMIPAEVIGLYLVGAGVIPAENRAYLLAWSLFCWLGAISLRILGTRDSAASKPPQWGAVLISAVAFVVWLYSIGGPFIAYLGEAYKPFLGSLMVLAWTFLVPLFYTPAE